MFTYSNETINIYCLQESNRTWIEIEEIDDLILLLGDDISFACTVAKLGVSQGSCIILLDGPFRRYKRYWNRNLPQNGKSKVFLDQFLPINNEDQGILRMLTRGILRMKTKRLFQSLPSLVSFYGLPVIGPLSIVYESSIFYIVMFWC